MPTDNQTPDPIDDLARRAGAELRRPAPAEGLVGVHRSHRRRRTATAAGAVGALAVIAGGTIVLANRGGDDDVVATEDPATTVVVETTDPSPPTVPETTGATEIDGTWWLLEIDGEAIVRDVNTIGVPEMIIGDGDLFGFFGCNVGGAEDLVIQPGRLTVGSIVRDRQVCSIPDGADEMVLSERVLVSMLEAGVDWSVDGDTMTWTGNGSVAVFTRDESELPSVLPTLPATLPTDPTTTIVHVDTTGTWWLSEIDGSPVELGVDAILQPFLVVDGDRMEGSLGCNTIEVSGVVTVGNRWAIDSSSLVVGASAPEGAPDDTDCAAVHSQRSMVDVLSAGPIVSVAAGTMRLRVNGRLLAFVESADGSVPAGTVTTTTVAPPDPQPGIDDGVAVSDEVLPDPMAFAADGFERVLVDRTITVRSNPDVVIPIDVPDSDLWLLGVGPTGVAYLRADRSDADGDTLSMRYIAVPTTGPTIGEVYELLAPQPVLGPWLGWLTSDGIRSYDLGQVIPYVDSSGRPLADPIDPTITWSRGYVEVDGNPSFIRAVVTEVATGRSFEAPVVESSRERVDPSAIRPLPDGRIVVRVLVESSTDDLLATPALMAFDPATETWTRHPAE